jgi:hypothetical protein
MPAMKLGSPRADPTLNRLVQRLIPGPRSTVTTRMNPPFGGRCRCCTNAPLRPAARLRIPAAAEGMRERLAGRTRRADDPVLDQGPAGAACRYCAAEQAGVGTRCVLVGITVR